VYRRDARCARQRIADSGFSYSRTSDVPMKPMRRTRHHRGVSIISFHG
jgi:hypothetical protein